MLSWEAVSDQITEAQQTHDPKLRVELAASISRFAAKAPDESLLLLSERTPLFVSWMSNNESGVVLHAYAACIIANIAFLPQGQLSLCTCGDAVGQIVHRVQGVTKSPSKDEQRVLVHCTAALQNITYKNPDGCETVLASGGEKILRKALKKAPLEMQQYISGALANLGLYRKGGGENGGGDGGKPSALGKFFGRGKNKGDRGGDGSSSLDSPRSVTGGGGGGGSGAYASDCSPSGGSSSGRDSRGGDRMTGSSSPAGGLLSPREDMQQDDLPPWHAQSSSGASGGMPRGRGVNSLVSAARAEANQLGGAGGLEGRQPLQMAPSSNIMGNYGGGGSINPWSDPTPPGLGGGGGGYPFGGGSALGGGPMAMRRPQRLAPISSNLTSKLPALPGIGQSAGGRPANTLSPVH